MRVLVISDSRGWPIYNQIMGINWLLLGMTLDILIYPGATISQGIRYAINDITYNAYDIIYVYLGVCNLSKKLSPHNIIPIYSNRYLMCRNLLIDYHTARRRLRPYCNKVIICELTGLNFELYNTASGHVFPVEQYVINAGVILINQYITAMNSDEGHFSPNLADITHKQRSEYGNLCHRYTATMSDGIHFNTQTNKRILDRFIINMLQA